MGRVEVHTVFYGGKMEEGGHLEDAGIDGRIILKWICEWLDGGIDWISMAKDRDRWWAFVNAVMNLRVP